MNVTLGIDELKSVAKWYPDTIDSYVGIVGDALDGRKFNLGEVVMVGYGRDFRVIGKARLSLANFESLGFAAETDTLRIAKPAQRRRRIPTVHPKVAARRSQHVREKVMEHIEILGEVHDGRPAFLDEAGKFVKLYYA